MELFCALSLSAALFCGVGWLLAAQHARHYQELSDKRTKQLQKYELVNEEMWR